jgi:hypothetical protein
MCVSLPARVVLVGPKLAYCIMALSITGIVALIVVDTPRMQKERAAIAECIKSRPADSDAYANCSYIMENGR